MKVKNAWKTLLLAPLTLVAVTRLPAAQTSFNPSLALGQFYTSNIAIVSEEQSSDTYTTLSLVLPVTTKTQRSTLSLSYNPSYQAYKEFTGFDNLSHAFNAMLDSSWERTNALNVSATFYHGQDQGRADSDLEGDFFLTERNTRNEGALRIDYSDRFSKTWLWGIGASAASLNYEEISDTEVIPPQDREGIGAYARFGRRVSPTTSVGFRAQVGQLTYDISGNQLVQLYSFEVNRQLNRQSSFDLSLGGFISDPDPEFRLPGEEEATSTGFQGSLAYSKSFSNLDLLLDASHRPALGANRGGPSTDSYASISISKPVTKRISGSLALRYARTEPLVSELDGTESLAVGGNLSWLALQVLALSVNVNYADQSPLNTGSIPTSTQVGLFDAGFSLVWYPFANRPFAKGAS